jgi:hypothetical protein
VRQVDAPLLWKCSIIACGCGKFPRMAVYLLIDSGSLGMEKVTGPVQYVLGLSSRHCHLQQTLPGCFQTLSSREPTGRWSWLSLIIFAEYEIPVLKGSLFDFLLHCRMCFPGHIFLLAHVKVTVPYLDLHYLVTAFWASEEMSSFGDIIPRCVNQCTREIPV